MEKLTEDQRKRLNKTSDVRLVYKLTQAGVSPEQLEKMDRQAMLGAMAELVLQGKEPTAGTAAVTYDAELERQKFEWQKQCYEREETGRQELEKQKFFLSQQELEQKLAIEKQKLQWEKDKWDIELKIKQQEAEKDRQQQAWKIKLDEDEREIRTRSSAARAKLFGDAMRNASVRMGSELIDAIPFFEGVEHLFSEFKVPDDLKVTLMRPYLSERAVKLLSQMEAKQLTEYDTVKQYILTQLRLSPRSLLDKFNTIWQQGHETTVLFASRLKTLLKYYLDSRKVTTFEKLISLLVSDRVKATLSDDCLNHVLSIEATVSDGWLPYDRLAEIIDTFHANRVNGRPRAAAIGVAQSPGRDQVRGPNEGAQGTGQKAPDRRVGKTTRPSAQGPKSCWQCGGPHLKRDCTQLAGSRSTYRPGEARSSGRSISVNQVTVTDEAVGDAQAGPGDSLVTASQCVITYPGQGRAATPDAAGALHGTSEGRSCRDLELTGAREQVNGESHLLSVTLPSAAPGGVDVNTSMVGPCKVTEVGPDTEAANVSLHDSVETLSYVHVGIQEVPGRTIKALNDSGAQLTIVRKQTLGEYHYPVYGTVKIRGLFGDSTSADVTYINVSLADCPQCSLRVLCAVSDDIHEQLIIPAAVITRLNDKYNECLVNEQCITNVDDNITVTVTSCNEQLLSTSNGITDDCSLDRDSRSDSAVTSSSADTDESHPVFVDVDQTQNNIIDSSIISVAELQREQKADETMAGPWALAKRGKGNFIIKDGILFGLEKICGQSIECLMVPEGRRRYVFEVAHTVTGGHFNFRKTRDRIKLSGLTWTTLTRDCKDWVGRCDICQKMARVTCYDRIPIQAVCRSPSLFAHFFCDILGPILPDQHTRYNYCLVLVDSNSLWVSAYPLRDVTAKSVCSALINLFSYTGLSTEVTVMSTDNASYFKSELTREFLKRIGVSPRFHTPHASWSTGLVERHLQTVKRVLAKLAADHPKQWAEYLPYALWALRESVSNPLQLQPFMLVTGGRRMRGPLSILRDTWLGFRNLPVSLGKRTEDFLKEVQSGLQSARACAEENTRLAQQRYVNNYNLRARPKKLVVGQACLILQPDSTASRMFSRWKGPATVREVKYPDSYVVELDGRRYHLHANHLRPYASSVDEVTCSVLQMKSMIINACDINVDCDRCDVCIDYCSVVYDTDTDFGNIGAVESVACGVQTPDISLKPSQRINSEELAHLDCSQRNQLLSLLDEYSECFSDIPGLCKNIVHEIPTTADFVPKRLRGHRIPESLRDEVDRQITELLRLGFIQESTSPMSSPIVAVVKPLGGVRVCVNYQYLNRFTVPDQITLPDVNTVIHRVGNSKFISTFDAPSGFHQCIIAEKDRWKTAFVCGYSLYEWRRCAFGLRSSGCTFVRALNRTLEPVRKFTENYVDDIAVHSSTWERHLAHLRHFLSVIARSGFSLSLKKAKWGQPHVKFLGQIIGSGDRRPDPDKVETVKLLRVPETKRQVRQILGLFCHFRDYLPDFAKVAQPLTELTGKRYAHRIPWGAREQEAFDTLKELLIRATLEPIGVIDNRKPFTVLVDACDYAVGGILTQQSETGLQRPVVFASSKLSATQRRWSTIEKECYAIIWALQKFKQWIWGVPTVVHSDHNPLTYLTETAPKNSKLMRWLLALQEYDNVRLEFRAGVDNAAADCVSRMVHKDD